MPASTPTAVDLRHATLRVEADDYTMSVDQVRFVPEPMLLDLRVFDTDGSDVVMPLCAWRVQVGFVQDLTDPESLALYLVRHAGQRRSMTFAASGRVIEAAVLILPAELGGQVNTIPASVVTMPVYGAPDFGLEVTP